MEKYFYHRYVEAARRDFQYALRWLSEDEFETTIHDLAILHLRKARLTERTNEEGTIRLTTRRRGNKTVTGETLTLSAGRYQTEIDNAWNKAYSRLLDPDEHRDLR